MSILKSIHHRYNTTSQDYDTLHPETEYAQVTDFGNGVLAHLLDSTLVSAVTAVSTGSLFGKLVEKLLEASGVQYNFTNSNAWYICLGSLFGGLIIQGGGIYDVSRGSRLTFPVTFTTCVRMSGNDMAGESSANMQVISFGNVSNTGTDVNAVRINQTDSNIWCHWLAIGR